MTRRLLDSAGNTGLEDLQTERCFSALVSFCCHRFPQVSLILMLVPPADSNSHSWRDRNGSRFQSHIKVCARAWKWALSAIQKQPITLEGTTITQQSDSSADEPPAHTLDQRLICWMSTKLLELLVPPEVTEERGWQVLYGRLWWWGCS